MWKYVYMQIKYTFISQIERYINQIKKLEIENKYVSVFFSRLINPIISLLPPYLQSKPHYST